MSLNGVCVKVEHLSEESEDVIMVEETASLYPDHEIKEEIVIGPTCLQPGDRVFIPRGHDDSNTNVKIKSRIDTCFVPSCPSTSSKDPYKLFLSGPSEPNLRAKWFQAAQRNVHYSPKTIIRCCEDHFDLENDVENWMKFKMLGGKLFLKKDVVPHIFECQNKMTPLKMKRRKFEILEHVEKLEPSSDSSADNHPAENTTEQSLSNNPSPQNILHSQNKHPCGICDEQFTSKDSLDPHIRVHINKPQCTQCVSINGACVRDIKNQSLSIQDLIDKGRRIPDLSFNQRHFDSYSWLTGCVHDYSLFCFYCLLFSKTKSVWTDTGVTDLQRFMTQAKKHDLSEMHIEAHLKFRSFGNNPVQTNSQSQIDDHNAKVDRNRSIFERLIDIGCYLGKQYFFCAEDGSIKDYSEWLEFFAKYDPVMENHLCNSTTFSAVSNQVQMDVISSIASVLDDYIKKQIDAADFVAVLLEAATDIDGEEKLVVVLRYFHESKVCDRFIRYVDVCGRSAEAISDVVLQTLADYNCLSKVTAQTYDGAAAACADRLGVAARLRRRCPLAIHAWCSAHALNHVLSESCAHILETRGFFGTITNLANFFHNDKRIQEHYNKIADAKRLPRVPAAHWKYDSRIIKVIFDGLPCLIELFEDLYEDGEPWDGDTLVQASIFEDCLNEFEFQFFLRVFSKIFSKTDVLSKTVDNIKSDVEYRRIDETIKKFESFLDSFVNKFEEIFEDVKTTGATPKRRRKVEDIKDDLKRVFGEILETVGSECIQRYDALEELNFTQLLLCDNFNTYQYRFPLDEINEFCDDYSLFKFNAERLKNELICIYKTLEFRKKNVYDLIEHFDVNGLNSVFPESVRLAKLIGTFPTNERSLLGLRHLHAHLRTPRRRLTDLSKIYLEQSLLNEMKRQSNFYDSVISIYSEKDNRFDFTYKR